MISKRSVMSLMLVGSLGLSLALAGCSGENESSTTSSVASSTQICELSTLGIDYCDGLDGAGNFYISVNVLDMDAGTYDVYYSAAGNVYTGTLESSDLEDIVDVLNKVDYMTIGEELPTTAPTTDTIEGLDEASEETASVDTSYLSSTLVYTDNNKTNNSLNRVSYCLTDTERSVMSEIRDVLNNSLVNNEKMVLNNSSEDIIGSDEVDESHENIDKVAESIIDSVISKAKEDGFEITAEDTVNGLAAGMSSYYTGIPTDDESWDDISSVTVHTSLLSVTAYQLVFIGVKDADKLDEIEQTVNDNLDWMRWVCVMPTNGCVTSFETTDTDKEINPDVAGYVVLLMGVDDPEFGVNTFTSVHDSLESVLGQEIEILEPAGDIYEVGSDVAVMDE